MTTKIGLIVGSLRKDSYNRKVAETVKELFPEGYEADYIEIGELDHYNEDLDNGNPPQSYVDFRRALDEHDGFVFFTPEYNRAIPGVLKNAVDVGSRPYGENKWTKKPVAVASATMGSTGAMAANHMLRQTFVFTDMLPMQQPEVYLSDMANSIGEDGKVVERTREFLQAFVDAYVEHVKLITGKN